MKIIIEAEPKEIATLAADVREPLDMDVIYEYVMDRFAKDLQGDTECVNHQDETDTASEPQLQS